MSKSLSVCVVQEGGLGGLMQRFIAEILAVVRGNVTSLGGNDPWSRTGWLSVWCSATQTKTRFVHANSFLIDFNCCFIWNSYCYFLMWCNLSTDAWSVRIVLNFFYFSRPVVYFFCPVLIYLLINSMLKYLNISLGF